MWVPRRTNLVFLAMVVADSSRATFAWTSSSHAPSSTFVSLAAAATPTLAESFTTTTSSEIIPREVLFGNPTYASPSLSPDGKYLAYLAPNNKEDNVLNVFVRSMMDLDNGISDDDDDNNNNKNGRAVTQDKSRGIRSFQWAEIDPINPVYSILYVQDQEGDENFHLYCVPLSPEILGSSTTTTTAGVDQVPIIPVARDLTPGDNVKVSSLMTNKRYPHELLVATNERDSSCFDMYRISHFQTDDPVKSLDTQNPGNVVGWGTEDESFEVRFALVRNQKDSSSTLQVRNRGSPSSTAAATTADASDSDWKELITFPYGEEGSFVDFCKDGTSCYITSTLNRDTKALLQVDLQTGATIQEIFSTDQCDVGGIMLDEDTKVVRMVSYNIARRERVFFDEELERDFQYLKELGPDGEVSIASQTTDETIWVVAYSRSDGPTEYQLYDQVKKTLKPLFVSRPELLKYKFAPMEDVRIPTRDGLELVGYLTRPKNTNEATPLILKVHGGPWARDSWGFSAADQWFANRGYATLSVNFRGSTGYGKSFLHKGDGEWGVGSMQHDLTDSVQWAIDQGIADPEKVCIYGGSYGGYACLAGLTFTPDLYRCGVDIVGPSNVKTLLDSIPSYWGPLRNQMLLKIGDVDSDEEFNKKISPLYHVDKIKAPLLIGQGANDPRVKQAEADQIAFSMQAKGIPVEYVLYPDEGHGFARPDNRIDFNGRVELFLKQHLGGRAQDFEKPKGSTAQFPLLDTDGSMKNE
jgi:dipeptidyl aminopeptidase/acylaminoacyl peptidase